VALCVNYESKFLCTPQVICEFLWSIFAYLLLFATAFFPPYLGLAPKSDSNLLERLRTE
jgi:hypothetical protein